MSGAPHLPELRVFRSLGGTVALQFHGGPQQTPANKHLILIGDSPDWPGRSHGPDGFDGADLAACLAKMDERRGCIGIFAGAPIPRAFGFLCGAALRLPAGAIIIECAERHWLAWSHYTFLHAPRAVRIDIVPPAQHAAAMAQIRAEGAAPVYAT